MPELQSYIRGKELAFSGDANTGAIRCLFVNFMGCRPLKRHMGRFMPPMFHHPRMSPGQAVFASGWAKAAGSLASLEAVTGTSQE